MRHIGVDLHKTNFVTCFIEADETQRLETYPLTRDGLARFTRQLNAQDEVAVEATQNVHYFYDQVKARVSRVRWWTLTASGWSPSRRRRRTRPTRRLWHGSSSWAGCRKCRCRVSRSGHCGSYSKPERRGLNAHEAQEHGARRLLP
jgi:hypothetical protein